MFSHTRRVIKCIFAPRFYQKTKLLQACISFIRDLYARLSWDKKKLTVTVQASFKLFVCIKIDPSGEEILYLVPRSVLMLSLLSLSNLFVV